MSEEDHVLDVSKDEVEDRGHALISSRRVEGTKVYDSAGKKLGSIYSIMLDKRSGQAAYAVLNTSGFLGFDRLVHPLPWSMLNYDEDKDGYVIDVTRDQLEEAPTFRIDEADRPREQTENDLIYSYYGVAFPY